MQLSDTDRDMMIRTIIGEAGDQSDIGKAAVAHVIMNRVATGQWGDSPTSVVLARGQFEPWQTRARQLRSINPNSPDYQNVGQIVDSVVGGQLPDPTRGATHFLDPAIVRRRRGGSLPDWAQGPGLPIGDHTFYAPQGPSNGIAAINAAMRDGSGRLPAGALSFSDDELNDTARALGINRGGTRPASAPAVEHTPQDLADTAAAMGITLGGTTKKPDLPPEIKTPAQSDFSEREKERLRAKGAGFPGAVVEGVPIAGPALQAGAAAGAAAMQPLTRDTGSTNFGDRFSQNLADIRGSNALYAQEHPLKAVAGNVLGGAAGYGLAAPYAPARFMMGLPTGATPTIGGQFYAGLSGGAAVNALDAAMRGNDPYTGAVLGAATGGGAPLVGAAARGVGNLIASRLRPPQELSGLNPIARGWLIDAAHGGATDPLGPASFFGEQNPALTRRLQGISFDAGQSGADVVRGAYNARTAGAAGRIEGYLDQSFGPRFNVVEAKNLLAEERKTAADPLYEQWRDMRVQPTPTLKALIPRLEKAGAFNMAEELSGISGEPINTKFFTGGPNKEFPTTQTWDYVKRGLDRRIDQAYNTGDKTLGRELVKLKGEMIDEIEKTPAGRIWQQARREFAQRSDLIDQINYGRDTFIGGRSGTSVNEFAEELKHLSTPEIIARVQGTRDAISEAMGESLRGPTTHRDKLLAPNNQQKLRMLFAKIGKPREADELIANLESERTIAAKTKQVIGGSQTESNIEAVKANKPPPLPEWNVKPLEPFTWIPPRILHELRPSTILQGSREQSYANAANALAPILTRNINDSALLHAEIARESLRRQAWARGGEMAGNALNIGVAQPGMSTFRLRAYEPRRIGPFIPEAQ